MNIFLILALIGLIAASINDIRKREVADWLSYSLFASMFALTLIHSILENNFLLLLYAAGFGIAIYATTTILYYSKLIGGGDVKLLTAISPVFIFLNLWNFLAFLVIASGAYGIIYALALAAFNWKKLRGKIKFNIFPVFALIFLVAGILINSAILYLLAVIAFSPYLIFFVGLVEKHILIKKYSPEKLTEGDWLLHDVKIKGKLIKAKADGLSEADIRFIKKAKAMVWIKEGIPYVPVLLIAFLAANLINILEILKAFF